MKYIKEELSEFTICDYDEVIQLWKTCGIKIELEDEIKHLSIFLLSDKSKGFILKKDKRIIAAVLCATDGRYGFIHHLAVMPEYRRFGYGKLMVEACRDFLFSFSFVNAIIVFVWDSNVNANIFWNKTGFKKFDALGTYGLMRTGSLCGNE
jgi:N-acetylglutamate synthase